MRIPCINVHGLWHCLLFHEGRSLALCWKLAVVFFDDWSLFLMVALPNVNVLLPPRVGFSITLPYCLTTNDLVGLVWDFNEAP